MLKKTIVAITFLITAFYLGRNSADIAGPANLKKDPAPIMNEVSTPLKPTASTSAKKIITAAPVVAPSKLRPRKERFSNEQMNRRIRRLKKIDPSEFLSDEEISRLETDSHQNSEN